MGDPEVFVRILFYWWKTGKVEGWGRRGRRGRTFRSGRTNFRNWHDNKRGTRTPKRPSHSQKGGVET